MTHTPDTEILFLLLRAGLRTERPGDAERFRSLCAAKTPDWAAIYRSAAGQGVLAIAWDGLERYIREEVLAPEHRPARTLKLQWGFNVERIERTWEQQRAVARELAERFAEAGIRTVVLKGLAAARNYPVPAHRPCGDLDCFLMGGYERGNRLAEQFGASVERDFYKHSHISYKGLTVENHQFCTAIRGSRRAKEFERALQRNLDETPPERLEDSHLEIPSPLFNALFLTVHAWVHFLNEGLSLRHLCDWVLLLHAHGRDIDWQRFRELSLRRDRGMYAFAESTTRLAHRFFGVSIPTGAVVGDEPDPRDERLMENTLFSRNLIYNRKESDWRKRIRLVENMWADRWKYRLFSEISSFRHIVRTVVSYLFERRPQL